MASALTTIRQEHRGLAAILNCMVTVIRDIEENALEPDFTLFGAMFDYVDGFLDRFHHPKENTYLFNALRQRHPDSAEVLDKLEAEHEEGPQRLAHARAAMEAFEQERGSKAARARALTSFRQAVEAYNAFEWAHMNLEESVVIPLAREHLTPEDWHAMDEAFNANEDPLFGSAPRNEFASLFNSIAALAPAPHGYGPRR
jgi:branched-chain amino acid transport system ATP-binding protein